MRIIALLITFVCSLASPTAEAAENSQLPVAIQGYSVVSYFTEGEPQLGSVDFAVEYEGKNYLFTNKAQQALFESDPKRYKPRYESCPFSLTLGMKLPLDPLNFKIVGGYLLLFHKSDNADGLVEWEKSGLSHEELLERADKSFTLLTF